MANNMLLAVDGKLFDDIEEMVGTGQWAGKPLYEAGPEDLIIFKKRYLKDYIRRFVRCCIAESLNDYD